VIRVPSSTLRTIPLTEAIWAYFTSALEVSPMGVSQPLVSLSTSLLKQQRHPGLFELEELFLDGEPAAEANEAPVVSDNPMAGDNDRDRIVVKRVSYRPGSARLPHASRQLSVAGGCSKWHFRQFGPDAQPELGSMKVQRHIKRMAMAVKILLDFRYRPVDYRVPFLDR